MQIPINRWIKAKGNKNNIDKMIDLGIVFESLYLSDIDGTTELAFRMRLHAAYYLRADKEHRKEIIEDFKKICNWRSKVVHTGRLPNKTQRTPFTQDEVTEFITKAQDLCRDSIIKIIENGEFPEWDSLILG